MAGLRGVVKIVVTIKLQLLRCVQGMSLMSCTALLRDVRFDMSHDRNRRDDLEYLKAHRFPVGSRIQKKPKNCFSFMNCFFELHPCLNMDQLKFVGLNLHVCPTAFFACSALHSVPVVMASIIDSEAQFDLRLNQVRVPPTLQLALKNSGVTTISSLAFALGLCSRPTWPADFQ